MIENENTTTKKVTKSYFMVIACSLRIGFYKNYFAMFLKLNYKLKHYYN